MSRNSQKFTALLKSKQVKYFVCEYLFSKDGKNCDQLDTNGKFAQRKYLENIMNNRSIYFFLSANFEVLNKSTLVIAIEMQMLT